LAARSCPDQIANDVAEVFARVVFDLK